MRLQCLKEKPIILTNITISLNLIKLAKYILYLGWKFSVKLIKEVLITERVGNCIRNQLCESF